MVLEEGKEWQSLTEKKTQNEEMKTSSLMTPVVATTSAASDNHDSGALTLSEPPVQPRIVQLPGTQQTDSPSSEGKKIQKRFTVPLPKLSTYVHDMLTAGKLLHCLTNLVSECAHFYMNQFPITTSMQYQEVGQQLHMKYPCIGFPRGTEPWTVFCEKLSQKIRNVRHNQKRKSSEPATRMPKQPKFSTSTPQTEIPEEDYKRHLKEIGTEMEKLKPSVPHIQLLLKETFLNRRKWLAELPTYSWGPVLEQYPCFENIEHIIHEYCMIQNKDNLKEEAANMEKLFQLVARNSDKKIQGTAVQKELMLINHLEKSIAYDKGKGKKSESVVTIKKDVEESDIEKACETKESSPPHIVCFVSNEELAEVAIVGDKKVIFCKTNSVLEAILYLVTVYYVMDLNYPRQFSMLLGILQQYIIKENYDGSVSGKFLKFCHYLDAEMAKQTS